MTIKQHTMSVVLAVVLACSMGFAVQGASGEIDLRQSTLVKAIPSAAIEGEGREALHAFTRMTVDAIADRVEKTPGMEKVLAMKKQELAFFELPDMTPASLSPWLHTQWAIEGDGESMPPVVHDACLQALHYTEGDIDQRIAALIVAAVTYFPDHIAFILPIIVQIGTYHDRLIVSFRQAPGPEIPEGKRKAIAEMSLFFEDLPAFVDEFKSNLPRMGRYLYKRTLQAKRFTDEQIKWAKVKGAENQAAAFKARNVLGRFVEILRRRVGPKK